MSHLLLEGVAATTVHRNRVELDRAFARLLLEFLDTTSVTLMKLLDADDLQQLVPRVRFTRDGPERSASASERFAKPHKLSESPEAERCISSGDIVESRSANGHYATTFPVCGGQKIVGVLVLETLSLLSRREVDLVRGILQILKNHLALLDYGEVDSLTGLLNRKTLETHFETVRQRLAGIPDAPAAESSSDPNSVAHEPSWLALIDIDRFKSINDGYGHLFGDEVLLLVSQLMRGVFRGADQLFRFGGEEFVVMLDEATEPGAQIAFERLRSTIEEHEFPQIGRVTISAGYTRIRATDVPALCVERADAALYYAKNHGRNSVWNCELLVGRGDIDAKFTTGDVEIF